MADIYFVSEMTPKWYLLKHVEFRDVTPQNFSITLLNKPCVMKRYYTFNKNRPGRQNHFMMGSMRDYSMTTKIF